MKRKNAGRGLFIVFAGLLSAATMTKLARGLPPALDAVPEGVRELYNSGSSVALHVMWRSAYEGNERSIQLSASAT